MLQQLSAELVYIIDMFHKHSFLAWIICFKPVRLFKYLTQSLFHLLHFPRLWAGRLTETTFLFKRQLTTTTKGTIKSKISFEKLSVTKGAAKSDVKEKKQQLLFATTGNISSHLYEKKLRYLLHPQSSKGSMKHFPCF